MFNEAYTATEIAEEFGTTAETIETKREETKPIIEKMEDAKAKINEAIEVLREAVCEAESIGTTEITERHANAYILAHLTNWAEGGNPYDESIPKMQNQLLEAVGYEAL